MDGDTQQERSMKITASRQNPLLSPLYAGKHDARSVLKKAFNLDPTELDDIVEFVRDMQLLESDDITPEVQKAHNDRSQTFGRVWKDFEEEWNSLELVGDRSRLIKPWGSVSSPLCITVSAPPDDI